MAGRVEFVYPVKEVHGKLDKDSNVSYRGKRSYTLKHPRTEKDFSEHEKQYRRSFGEMNKRASQINKDVTRLAEYQDWREKGYRSRYRYILSILIAECTSQEGE